MSTDSFPNVNDPQWSEYMIAAILPIEDPRDSNETLADRMYEALYLAHRDRDTRLVFEVAHFEADAQGYVVLQTGKPEVLPETFQPALPKGSIRLEVNVSGEGGLETVFAYFFDDIFDPACQPWTYEIHRGGPDLVPNPPTITRQLA